MAKVAPDYSFAREGKTLGEWLRLLVGEDAAQRLRAGEMLQAMQYGVPSAHTHLETLDPVPDMAAQSERFKQAVRDAVETPGFDTADFVSRLCARRLANSRDWLRRCEEARKLREPVEAQYERIADRLVRKMNAAGVSQAAQDAATARIARAIFASCEHDQKSWERATAGAEAMTMASFMAYAIFVALDRAFLAAPEALLLLIEYDDRPHDAFDALARIGPAAAMFAPLLIERLDHLPHAADTAPYGFDAAPALGAIGRDNPTVVEAMIQRLQSPHEIIRAAAAETLVHTGTAAAGRSEAIFPLLHGMFDRGRGTDFWASVGAVASVGRNDPASRRRIVDLARPRPPRMVSPPDYPQHTYDEVMHERGVAINAMRFLTDYPDECVPALIEAIASFEEFDPDESYDGPVGRVSDALARFGPRAGPDAAIALAQHLNDDEGDYPKAICLALGAMGASAAAALPLLEEFSRKDGEPWQPSPAEPEPDPNSSTAAWAVHRIRKAL